MKFTTVLALVLPAAGFAQMVTTTSATTTATSSPVPSPTPTQTLESICESQAGPYAQKCPRCLHTCATSSAPSDCYYSVFSVVNEVESDCEAHGGNNCEGQALDQVCGA